MAVIQFKRVLDFYPDGFDYASALARLKTLEWKDGEPVICSYNDNGELKYLFAIQASGNLHSFPMFASLQEIKNFIQSNSSIINIIDSISEESDVTASADTSGKLILKVKDNFKNVWINLNDE